MQGIEPQKSPTSMDAVSTATATPSNGVPPSSTNTNNESRMPTETGLNGTSTTTAPTPGAPSNGTSATTTTVNAPARPLQILDAKASLAGDGVEKVDSVEWGPGKHEDGYDSDQTLAPKPRAERSGEPCGCQTPDAVLNAQPEPGEDPSKALEELIKKHMCCRDDSCVNYAMREECRSNCEAADFCGNKRLQNKNYMPTAVIDAGPKGKGLAVLTDCKKGDFLAEYVGQAISNKALPKLFRKYQRERRLYIMALDDKTYIDARRKGGVARFINHSCSPNAKVERWKVKGVLRAVVVAIKDIPKFSEVTFDYQWQRQRGRALTKCHCLEPNCRGTLEQQALSKEQQDQNLQKQQEGAEESTAGLPEGRWLKGLSSWTENLPDKDTFQKPDDTLINRAIRVYSKEHMEYFVGEVTGYDPEKREHEVLYQEDYVEVWEKLHESDWMVLVEENPQQSALSISRKAKRMKASSSADGKEAESLKSLLIPASSKPLKNYIYVQTPVKDALWARHLVERCERTCGVQIRASSHNRTSSSNGSDDSEESEKFAALDQSRDGVVWKLTITGGDILRAHNILTKNVAYVKRMLEENAPARASGATTPPSTPSEQVIYPRLIADAVKRKFQQIRDRCRNVNVSFAPSESIGKQFSRLVIEGNAGSDLENAKSFIWSTLLNLCIEMKAPLADHGIPRNLGFLGGVLTKQQLALLGVVPKDPFPKPSTEGDDTAPQYKGAFFKSFGSAFKCTVWVQPDEDMGRISSSHLVVGDAMSTDQRKVYIGSDPKDIPNRWKQIQERVRDLEGGMRFIHLGGDRIYQPLMLQHDLFRWVNSVTGASVTIDTLTGDNLMIDGGGVANPSVLPPEVVSLDAKEKAELAAEIVRLQIEIYRDHFVRKQAWTFGRDWSLAVSAGPGHDATHSLKSVFGKLDEKSAQQCCMEIAGIVANMDLRKDIAAHAAVILYRFLSVESSPNMKAREAALACAFIANKAQKQHKWRKIDGLVKAAYVTFYNETEFDPNREDVHVLVERVISAESEILEKLQYDVFFRDSTSIMGIMEAFMGKQKSLPAEVAELAFSGQVLGAGSELWLKFGIEYIFLACACLLGGDVRASVSVLSLIPLKVQTAVEIIVDNVKFGPPATSGFLAQSRNDAKKRLGPIRQSFVAMMQQPLVAKTLPEKAKSARRNRAIAEDSQRKYIVRGVSSRECREHILPHLGRIVTDACCSVFIDPSPYPETNDIILVGAWRAAALAEYAISNLVSLPSGFEMNSENSVGPTAYNSKMRPGVLTTAEVKTNKEWAETNHSMAWAHGKGIHLGGKNCIAASVSQAVLGSCGLRWWVPKEVATNQTGTVSASFLGRYPSESYTKQLASFASAFIGDLSSFPILQSLSLGAKKETHDQSQDVAISLQRWPPEKISRNEEKKASKSKKNMQIGFSPAALQEMQLLTRLHSLVNSPSGHPNFVLPVAIGLPAVEESKKETQKEEEDPMFALFKSAEEVHSATQKDKKVKESPQIVFEPCPFVLPRFLSRKKGADDLISFPSVLSAWFYDLISALAHCHDNGVILRSIQPDQIVIDSSGVAKLGGLYRSTIYGPQERGSAYEPLYLAKRAFKKKGEDNDDDMIVTSTTAPELLLGCPRHSVETDVWMIGCLLSQLLLGKPVFNGKDRSSLFKAQCKVVGTPGSKNYPEAKEFPLFEKPLKKYGRGVEKFFEHVMGSEAFGRCRNHVDLIASMLHLDPRLRCSAETALQHPCIAHLNSTADPTRRHDFALQWNQLKDTLLRSQEQRSESKSYQKRKAMLISAVGDAGGDKSDDLYDLDDLLEPTKKSRTG